MVVAVVSFIAWFISHNAGLTLVYNDAMSHINISRLVVDNQEPGMAQIGSVWLPLNHILPLLFVWNDWAWKTGIAGSIFSMASYVISVLAISKTVFHLTRNHAAALVGGLAFATNLNILYLQTTPLTEPLYIVLFALSTLVFTLYLIRKNNAKYLLLLGIIGFLQVITRYDGWFVVGIQAIVIAINELVLSKKTMQELIGKLVLFGLPVFFGISLWLLWNATIFGNPLYFAYGEYSAHAQQRVIEENAGLLTKGNIITSLSVYAFAMLHNIGIFTIILSVIGAVLFFTRKLYTSMQKKALFLLVLLSPIIFNILALFIGFSTITVPEFLASSSDVAWFNVRYGLLALPFVAILAGLVVSKTKGSIILVSMILLLQSIIMYNTGIVTILDGTSGASSFNNHAVSSMLQTSVQQDDTILMSVGVFNPVAFSSNIKLRQIIHEGVSHKWSDALHNPQVHADWIVMSSNPKRGDPVRIGLETTYANTYLQHFEKVYEDKEATVYKAKQATTVSIKEVQN